MWFNEWICCFSNSFWRWCWTVVVLLSLFLRSLRNQCLSLITSFSWSQVCWRMDDKATCAFSPTSCSSSSIFKFGLHHPSLRSDIPKSILRILLPVSSGFLNNTSFPTKLYFFCESCSQPSRGRCWGGKDLFRMIYTVKPVSISGKANGDWFVMPWVEDYGISSDGPFTFLSQHITLQGERRHGLIRKHVWTGSGQGLLQPSYSILTLETGRAHSNKTGHTNSQMHHFLSSDSLDPFMCCEKQEILWLQCYAAVAMVHSTGELGQTSKDQIHLPGCLIYIKKKYFLCTKFKKVCRIFIKSYLLVPWFFCTTSGCLFVDFLWYLVLFSVENGFWG